jgi:septum site-determining protein MinD
VILAVAGGKGGVGKSTVAFSLAGATDAVLVDADLGMADLPTGRGPDLHDVLAGRAEPCEAVRGGPVDIVPCGRSLAGARAADVTRLAEVLETLAAEFGDVLVDCPAGLSADVGVPLAVADACLLVASPRRFALADAIRTRELARELDAGLVAVALNRTGSDPPSAAVRRALGAPVVAVPETDTLRRSVTAGEPVAPTESSRAGDAVADLAAALRRCQ